MGPKFAGRGSGHTNGPRGIRGGRRGRGGRGNVRRGHRGRGNGSVRQDGQRGESVNPMLSIQEADIGMKWPPVVKDIKVHGEIQDVNGRNIPRDQGRSFELGGNHYYVFGDTFCHDDKRQFVGTTDNTIAYIPDISKPNMSQYLTKQARVPQFIPYTESEKAYTNGPENKKQNSRIVLWNFGGVIEDSPKCGTGWVFFDKLITNGSTAGHVFGISVARVSLYNGHHVRVDRVMGDKMIFGPNEPRFGSISNLPDSDGYVYLFGHRDRFKPLDLRNHWARIRHTADFTDRSNYEFLLSDGTWSTSYTIQTLKRVMDVQAQGATLKLPGFAPRRKGPYMWFGVSKYMASALFVGTAKQLSGPWDVKDVMPIPKFLGEKSDARYCLYPHPWGADLRKGQMLVSWTDNGDFGGRVICATLTFEMNGATSDVEVTDQQHQTQMEIPNAIETSEMLDSPSSSSPGVGNLINRLKKVLHT